MAWTLIQQYDKASEPDFLKKVQVACVQVATEVQKEADTVQNHTVRAKLAYALVNNSGGYVARFALVAATVNAVEVQAASDASIINAVRSNWDVMALGG